MKWRPEILATVLKMPHLAMVCVPSWLHWTAVLEWSLQTNPKFKRGLFLSFDWDMSLVIRKIKLRRGSFLKRDPSPSVSSVFCSPFVSLLSPFLPLAIIISAPFLPFIPALIKALPPPTVSSWQHGTVGIFWENAHLTKEPKIQSIYKTMHLSTQEIQKGTV